MSRVLFRSDAPVTLIGGGPVEAGQIREALDLAPVALAADGGADVNLPAGREFSAVIGDLDSATGLDALRARGVPVHRIDDQNTVDLVKCLYSVEAPAYLGLGFLGGRIDHHMASMNAMVSRPWQKVVLLGGEDVCFLCPEEFRIDLPEGARVSLLPMAPMRGLACDGLCWSVEGLDLAPDERICVSNRATGGPLRLQFDAAKAILVLPAGLLDTVTRTLWRADRGRIAGAT